MLQIPKVIPALRHPDEWKNLPQRSDPRWVFLLGGNLSSVSEPVARLQRKGWRVFVHVDMLKGLTPDLEGLRFFRDYAGPDGIITTHSQTVIAGRKLGLWTIQRVFLLDSQSVLTGVAQVRSAGPDAVEALPALLPRTVRAVARQLPVPVIAGGLITCRDDIEMILAAGARGISTSSPLLWPYRTVDERRQTKGEGYMQRRAYRVSDPTGLHARPAAEVVRACARAPFDIRMEFRGKVANGKSILHVLALGVRQGDVLEVVYDTDDPQSVDEVEAGFHHVLEPEPEGEGREVGEKI